MDFIWKGMKLSKMQIAIIPVLSYKTKVPKKNIIFKVKVKYWLYFLLTYLYFSRMYSVFSFFFSVMLEFN